MATEADDSSALVSTSPEESSVFAAELAELGQNVTRAIPESTQWDRLRASLKANSDMLASHLVTKQFKDLQPLLPYIEGVLIVINRCIKASNTYGTTEKLLENTQNLKQNSRYGIEKQLGKAKAKLFSTIQNAESTFFDINLILLRVLNGRSTLSYRKMFSFAYSLRNLRGQLDTIETCLNEAIKIFGIPGIKSPDQRRSSFERCAHVLGKMAVIFSDVEETDETEENEGDSSNAANTETFNDYQAELKNIGANHDAVKSKLTEWQHKFWTRNRLRVWPIVIGCSCILWAAMAAAYFFEGTPAIYTFFILFSLFLLVRMEQTQERVYVVGVGIALLAILLEADGLPALSLFNVAGAAFTAVEFMQYLELNIFG